ncbi:MAG: PEP-CTERM sorting domain-containing protein [Phycisphaerales bacterium]|nr:MAG: PEP-CTERM sorting domain-containing protein [Phycisphaerales bacterium]
MRIVIAGLCVLAFGTAAMGVPMYDKYKVDGTVGLLPWPIDATDALNGMFGTVEAGGFHAATPAPGEVDLTDGIEGAGVEAVLADFSNPSLQIRYDFTTPINVREIRVFASNPGPPYNSRAYQNYDVEYMLDGDPTTYELLDYVRSTEYGNWNGQTEFVGSTATRIRNDSYGWLLQDVVQLRFRFYCVGQTTGGFWDPWDAGHPEDTDGNPAAFEASIIKEIDVIDVIPEPASLMLLALGGLALLRRR